MYYEIKIGSVKRKLELFRVNESTCIAALIIFNDVELTIEAAKLLLEKNGNFDIIVTPEAKSIPLAYEMARQSGKPYVVARKAKKLYMNDSVSVIVKSITTGNEQVLYLSKNDKELIENKNVLILDDVISTGNSIKSLEELITQVGGVVVGKSAILAEGEAINRTDITYIETLPLFDVNGNIK